MKILVCGGRDFNDYERVEDALNPLKNKITTLIHGGASGADSLADLWATRNNIHTEIFRAEWSKYGKSAGFRRNILMLDQNPDVVIAFPGGKGTQSTVTNAIKRNIMVSYK